MREMIQDVSRAVPHVAISAPTIIYTDSKACVELSVDAVAFKKTKHIMRAAEFLRDLVLRRVFILKHISGVSNPADVMTKPLPRGTFVLIIDLIDTFVDTVNVPKIETL